jgi:hypothetical protein
MAIQPIDLQTIYTQLDKVSKSTVAQQQGAHLARAIQQDEQQRQESLRSETVKELRAGNEGIAAVDERDGGNTQEQKRGKKQNGRGDSPDEKNRGQFSFTESHLGQHIDVTG